jgi:CBS domain-containing protein
MASVSEYCCYEPVTVRPHTTVLEAAAALPEDHIGCAVVVEDGPAGPVPVGTLTDGDIVRGLLQQLAPKLRSIPVAELMTPEPTLANETDHLADTLLTMRAEGLHCLPVVSAKGTLVGVISFDDILDYVHDELGDLAHLIGRKHRDDRHLAG